MTETLFIDSKNFQSIVGGAVALIRIDIGGMTSISVSDTLSRNVDVLKNTSQLITVHLSLIFSDDLRRLDCEMLCFLEYEKSRLDESVLEKYVTCTIAICPIDLSDV